MSNEVYTKKTTSSRYSDEVTAMLGVLWSLEREGIKIVRCEVDHNSVPQIMVASGADLDGWAVWECGQHTEMVPFADGRYPDTPYQRQIEVPETNVLVYQLVYKEAE